MTPGRVAYEAYSEAVGGASAVTGTVLPSWSGLTDRTRAAWEAAAEAVARPRPKVAEVKVVLNPEQMAELHAHIEKVAASYRSMVSTGTMPAEGNPGGGDPVIIPPNTPQPY